MAPSTKDLSFSPEDNLSRYLYRIREYPMLEPEEELDLARRWQE
ncbi:MAG TPA: RNA polymerase factor sigma-32, partial [Rhodospirillaceae bacterium]|nr:RNA polymerase factor sigma-32 [Rhodospirillaceae bacterium]